MADDSNKPAPAKQPSAVREYAIDWSYQGGISVRDLRDGIPVAEWEEHVVEASALAELQAKYDELIADVTEEEHERHKAIGERNQWREAAEKLAGALELAQTSLDHCEGGAAHRAYGLLADALNEFATWKERMK